MTPEGLFADPERAVLAGTAIDPLASPAVLDVSPARLAERVAELARPVFVPSSMSAADLTRAESVPGWERRSFLERARGRIVVLAHPEGLERAAWATLWRAPGLRLVAALRRRGAPPPAWPAVFPRAAEPPEPGAALRARLEPAGTAAPVDLEPARRRLAGVEVGDEVWGSLGEVVPLLPRGALGEGDAALHRAIRLLVAWAALCGEGSVAAADVGWRLRAVFGAREPVERSPDPAPGLPETGRAGSRSDDLAADSVELPAIPSAGAPVPGRRSPGPTGRRGRVLRTARPSWRKEPIDVPATLRRALPFQVLRGRSPGARPIVTADDLRTAVRRPRGGTVHYVLLDASGSMGGEAIRIGRGAALAILEDAYRTRESVGLVVLAGGRAVLAARPTRAPERLRRLVLSERARGGTPLAAGLALVLDRIRKDGHPATVGLATDGRANLTLAGSRDEGRAEAETARLLEALAALGSRPYVLARARDRRAAAFAERHGLERVVVHPLTPARRR